MLYMNVSALLVPEGVFLLTYIYLQQIFSPRHCCCVVCVHFHMSMYEGYLQPYHYNPSQQ